MFIIQRPLRLFAFFAIFLTAQQQFVMPKTPSVAQNENSSQVDTQLIHSVAGRDLYRAYCASCHGREAHGDGPAAPALRTRVPDLTLIAKDNNGVFPSSRVKRIISGDEMWISHGSREMPVWGPIFHQVEADQDWGNVRLQNLTQYLESIQKR